MVNRCSLYKECEKIVDDVLIHCARAKVLWMFLPSIFGCFQL